MVLFREFSIAYPEHVEDIIVFIIAVYSFSHADSRMSMPLEINSLKAKHRRERNAIITADQKNTNLLLQTL